MEIRVEKAAFSYENHPILTDVDVTLREGGITMLIGPNGVGKTTFLKLLLGMLKPNRGTVYYGETEMKNLTVQKVSRMVAYMPQHRHIPEGYPVEEYVLLGMTPYLSYFEIPSRRHKEKVEEILREIGLYDLRKQGMDLLSGGERQLVYFARARAQDTPWLFLDEPLASLDYHRQHAFMHRLCRYEKESGQSILLTVHDPNMVLAYADRVLLLDKEGRLSSICKNDSEFENNLTKMLNQVYGSQLQLIKNQEVSFYHWKE